MNNITFLKENLIASKLYTKEALYDLQTNYDLNLNPFVKSYTRELLINNIKNIEYVLNVIEENN